MMMNLLITCRVFNMEFKRSRDLYLHLVNPGRFQAHIMVHFMTNGGQITTYLDGEKQSMACALDGLHLELVANATAVIQAHKHGVM